MDCNCISEVEKNLLENNPKYKKVSIETGLVIMGNSLESRVAIALTLISESKTGKEKVIKNHIYASFCPFCGKSAKKEES